MTNKRDIFAYVISILSGLIICLVVVKISANREAWDSPSYFPIALPLMSFIIFAVALWRPERPWRWTLGQALGQSITTLLGGAESNLWPLGIVAMIVCSLPQFIAGWLAGFIKRRTN